MAHTSIRQRPSFMLGMLYVLSGGGFAWAASRYDMGTLDYMGPGYFPFALGLLLASLGLVIIARAVLTNGPVVRLPSWHLRSLAWMVGSVLMFALTLRPLGLALALVLLVVLASMASREFRWMTALANSAAMVVVNVGVFVYGLSLPLPLLPELVNLGG